MSEYIHEFKQESSGTIPWIDLDNITKIPETFREKFTETDFAKVIQRNVERVVIPKEAALMSVAGMSVPQVNHDNIHLSITNQPAGGVAIEYPVNPRTTNTAEIQAVKDKPTVLRQLDRADLSYLVTPEANILGEQNVIHAEYLAESKEQLAAKIDDEFLRGIEKQAGNKKTDANWKAVSDGDYSANVDKDLNDAIETILSKTAINPNMGNGSGSMWTLVCPVELWGTLKQTRVIDNHRLTYEQYLLEKHKTQILWKREPFDFTSDRTSDQKKSAYLFPTMDRHVGSMYIFTGRAGVPNMYREISPKGERVTMQYWFSYIPAANEETGSYADGENNRVYKFVEATESS